MSDSWDNPSAYEGLAHPANALSPHQHRFTIPVEWEEQRYERSGESVKKVTKLRCECGEETNR